MKKAKKEANTRIGWQKLDLRSSLISSLALFNWSGSEAAHFGVAAELRPLSDTRTTGDRF
jgi:hypothetical protein